MASNGWAGVTVGVVGCGGFWVLNGFAYFNLCASTLLLVAPTIENIHDVSHDVIQ